MGIRNCKDIGENMQRVARRLLANDNLCKLLYYTDHDPLSQPNLTEKQKEEEIFNKLLRMVPRLRPVETANSIVGIFASEGQRISSNTEFKIVTIEAEIYVPVTQWLIKGTNLRPYAIMGEIQESLDGKIINGLGKLEGGDFKYNFGSDEMTDFLQVYALTSYA